MSAFAVSELSTDLDGSDMNRPVSQAFAAWAAFAKTEWTPACGRAKQILPEGSLAVPRAMPMIQSDMIDAAFHPLVRGLPPGWASGWGEDELGVYVEFSVGNVSQRMRWVPPGQFLMGSPEDEERYEDDGPQHEVRLEQGFWMLDTPVRQSPWDAVMGENPSQFKGTERSVENVDCEMAAAFLTRLSERLPGLDLSLPSETQWEFACRAGTQTATYAEPGEVLENLAWFDTNSESETHPVGFKRGNGFDLFDMLGNVWELCADHWHGNYDGAPTDGTAWLSDSASASRVMRGGAWSAPAGRVRAAYRNNLPPESRDVNVGFRCVRVPS
jgi:formylglycine-generating enzyme required for sulfatase activity